MKTGYTCIFPDGTEGRASDAGEPPVFQFGHDAPITVKATLINIRGRIVDDEFVVVARGAFDPIRDVGLLIQRNGSVRVLEPTRGPNAIYLEEDGVASWIPAFGPDGNPISELRYSDGRPPKSVHDFTHPQAPSNRIEVWNNERVVVHQEIDGWLLSESALAPNGHTRILIKDPAGVVQVVWHTPTSFTSTPSQFALTPIGPVVAINCPNDGASFFRYPSQFRPQDVYPAPSPVPTPEPQPEPTPVPVPVPVPGPQPTPEPQPEPPPQPKPKPWWRKLLDALVQILNSQGGRP